MPPPNQQPSPGQPFPLPIDRQKSSIPKGRRWPAAVTWFLIGCNADPDPGGKKVPES